MNTILFIMTVSVVLSGGVSSLEEKKRDGIVKSISCLLCPVPPAIPCGRCPICIRGREIDYSGELFLVRKSRELLFNLHGLPCSICDRPPQRCRPCPKCTSTNKVSCPYNGVRVSNKCLVFSPGPYYYDEGKAFCEGLRRGQMLEFNRQTIEDIQNSDLSLVDDDSSYLIDLREGGSFFLSGNGQRVSVEDPHWDNAGGFPSPNEDCAAIVQLSSGDFKLRTYTCTSTFRVLCQRSGPICNNTEVEVLGNCLLFGGVTKQYHEAASYCDGLSNGYKWFSYDKDTVSALFQSSFSVAASNYFIHLRRPYLAPSGEVVTWEDPHWADLGPFMSGIPQPFSDLFNCVVLVPGSGFQMASAACDEQVPVASPSGVICEVR